MKDLFIPTRHGRVHAVTSGEGPGLVLLHTLGGSAHQFDDLFSIAGQRYHTVAIEMIGHGDSDPLIGHLAIEDHADSIADAIITLGLRDLTIFGQSVGAYLATVIGGRRPEACARVVIGEAPPRTEADYSPNWAEIERSCVVLTSTLETLQPRFRNLTPSLLERWNLDRQKVGVRALLATYWAIREFDFANALRHLRVPAQLLIGEKGIAASGLAERCAGLAAECKLPLYVLPDVGHFISIDDPGRLIAHIDAFVSADRQVRLTDASTAPS